MRKDSEYDESGMNVKLSLGAYKYYSTWQREDGIKMYVSEE